MTIIDWVLTIMSVVIVAMILVFIWVTFRLREDETLSRNSERPSPYILARARKVAESMREDAKTLAQIERSEGHTLHGRDIINLMSMASDLEIQYRLAPEKKSLFSPCKLLPIRHIL